MSSNIRLSREEWNQLDNLLGKHGFGGYYDLVECLKIVLIDLGFGNTGVDLDGEGGIRLNLPEAVKLLQNWSFKLSHTEGFEKIAEKASEKEE